jgi:hypothetical protein
MPAWKVGATSPENSSIRTADSRDNNLPKKQTGLRAPPNEGMRGARESGGALLGARGS